MLLDTRTAPGGDSVYTFSGILICGCCGGRMTRKTVPYKEEKYHYYYCPTTRKRGCLNAVSLKEEALNRCILDSLKAHIANVASLDAILAGSDGQKAVDAIARQYTEQISDNEKQIARISKFQNTLYENLISGNLNKEEYQTMKAEYSRDKTKYLNAKDILIQQKEDILTGKGERLRWREHFRRFEGLEALDRRMVISLIQSIRAVSKTELQITFNYQA